MRYLESGADVDVLFTDIDLRGRMDGSMLAQHARAKLRPNLPIVYASGALFAVRPGAAGAALDVRDEAL